MELLTTHWVLWLLLLVRNVEVLDNGLARTPPMGWMSWGYYMCANDCVRYPDKCLDENLIMSVADAFYEQGYQEAGYEYIVIDDCWSERRRDRQGRLVPSKKRFPRGMKFLADYIHKRGLKFGMYTNIGETTCMRYPGSRYYFKEDIQQFADWEIDYLKVDGCFVEYSHLEKAYIIVERHLNKTGRPIVYSCSWPFYSVFVHNRTFDFNKSVKNCHLWRNYHDVNPVFGWDSLVDIIRYFETEYEKLAPYHGPGHWHDPDMLLIGTGNLTSSQSRLQMAVYSMLSAPLLISCPMDQITPAEKKMLLNMNLLAIAQDPLGIMAKPYKLGHVTMWVKRHMPVKGNLYHSFSFAFVNIFEITQTVKYVPGKYGLKSPDNYTVLDIFENEYIYNITLYDSIEVMVPPQDVVLYTMYPL